ncbi:carboxymuconolactone decarboxylase family protein [Chloroflexota bacterium]
MGTSESAKKGKEIVNILRGGKDEPTAFERPFPQYWKLTEENLFGDIWGRPGLALRDRSIATMAAQVATSGLGGLKIHVGFALNLGISREEITELIMHVAMYSGWGKGASALLVAKEVFDARDKEGK